MGRARFPALLQRKSKNGTLHRDRIGVCAEAALALQSRRENVFELQAFVQTPAVAVANRFWIYRSGSQPACHEQATTLKEI
jgi:hypothetical protein